MRAAQRASARHPSNSSLLAESTLRLFCQYCLRPLISEASRSRHVANSPFCREAEVAAIMNGGPSMEPAPTHSERMVDVPKSALVDSVLDDMPAYITDEIARVLDELVVDTSEGNGASAGGTTGWRDMVAEVSVFDGRGYVWLTRWLLNLAGVVAAPCLEHCHRDKCCERSRFTSRGRTRRST